jgi:DNA-binding CsgD family transcriptional regulator
VECRKLEAWAHWYLGRCGQAVEAFRTAAAVAARAGDTGASVEASNEAATLLVLAGRPEDGIALARTNRLEAARAGLPDLESFAGEVELHALVLRGRLTAAEGLLDQLRTTGVRDFKYRELAAELALALGDIDAARAHDDWTISLLEDIDFIPIEEVAVRRAAIYTAVGDAEREAHWATRFLAATSASDSPLFAAIGTYLGLRSLTRPPASSDVASLRAGTERALRLAEAGWSSSWDGTWYAAYLGFARAYAARRAGRPAVEEWTEGVERAAPIGAYLALQPRLELAAELLRAGDRGPGREQLVEVWLDAREMGAGWYERQAAATATRWRVPLPKEGEAAGPLHRLTAREREVLQLLASGATDKDIASALVISRRTASIHVGNILAKLDVPNRGTAAAVARDLGPITAEN